MKKIRMYQVLWLVLIMVLFTSSSAWAASWVSLVYQRLDYRVNNMPYDFRFVPIHPDDDYADEEDNGPIDRLGYDRHYGLNIEYGYSWNKGRWDLGLGFSWIFSAIDITDDVDIRNYTNAPGTEKRGYGAALTFVSTEVRGLMPKTKVNFIDFIFNFTPKIFVKYRLDKEGKYLIGSTLTYHQFNAINGWDRYDSYEVDDTQTLAHIFPLSAELTLFGFLNLGVSRNFYYLTHFGRQAETEIKDTTFSIKFEGKF